MKVAAVKRLLESGEELAALLAVQPVYASNLDVMAFDLLLDRQSHALDLPALSRLIVDTYGSVYQGGLLQCVPCFLPVNAGFLLDADPPELPRNMYILEIGADIQPVPELLERLRQLARQGHRLALSGYPAPDELLDIVHILRLDLGAIPDAELAATLNLLKPRNLDLFADKLESPARFRAAVEAGFRYFRGDILGRPDGAGSHALGSNKLLLIQLLAELANPDTSLEALEAIIIRDANLTYKFLKAVNSATYGISKPIETLGYALAILGTVQIRRWTSLFLLERHDSKPGDLVRQMLVRGRMCEILAELGGLPNTTRYFITGLLSQLDVLTDIPMAELMAKVPLDPEIKAALLSRAGAMGELLREVEDYEQGRFERLGRLPDRSFYEAGYRHSTAWARQLQAALKE